MKHRKYNPKLVDAQEKLRNIIITSFFEFSVLNFENALAKESEVKELLNTLVNDTKHSKDGDFFKSYQYLMEALFHLITWGKKEMNAEDGTLHLRACKTNAEQIDLEYSDNTPDFKALLQALIQSILSVEKVKEIKTILDEFLKISFPTFFTFEVLPPFGRVTDIIKSDEGLEEGEDSVEVNTIVVSIEFTIAGEPWANPQILKPNELYTIKGKINVNQWPEGYDELILQPASTSNKDWFTFSVDPIIKGSENEYTIDGQVVFKYAQSAIDELISIRLLGYFSKTNKPGYYYPTIIGYDQLICKVLDPEKHYFLTGFKNMNKVVTDIAIQISKELPNLNKTDKDNFITLLSGIVNYQGFCLQQGIYKNQNKVLEDDFRDDLIRHLIAMPSLGEEVTKEPHVAGGRVEIFYKGIVAELKVEKSISERTKLYEKYGNQPVAYASGNTQLLSILCILDLTEKKSPPAAAQNNIKLLTPKLHGFESNTPEYPSKLVLIVIDGNTKKPSDYSK